MKKLLIMMVFSLLALSSFGQEVAKVVEMRLNPIINTVEVSADEKKLLIAAIEKFQKNANEIRKSESETKQEELKKNSQQYLKDIKNILGDKRFNKWRQDAKENKATSND